ncbi:MAG: hypothetical protein ACYS32_04150 [Planctomycetota bacterium]
MHKKKKNKKKADAVISSNVVYEGDIIKGDIVIKIHKGKIEIENNQRFNKKV